MRVRRGFFAAIALLAVFAAAIGAWSHHAARPQFERIYVVTIDTLRADHVSALGYPRQTTPFLDSLAQKGALFEPAFSACSHTAPSHASIFTGLFPFQHGVRKNHDELPASVPSLPSIMGRAGYQALAFPAVGFLDAKVGFAAYPVPFTKRMPKDRYYS